MKSVILLPILNVIFFINSLAQAALSEKAPKVGDVAPDFYFTDINIAGRKTLSKKDLHGKYVILDFWTTNCIGCVQSFPKINALQQKFKDRIEFILVGSDAIRSNGIEGAKKLFSKLEKFQNLSLNTAFDTSSFRTYGIEGVSWFVWIDPSGIVRGTTGIELLTKENIQLFLEGKEISSRNDHVASFDESKPLLIKGNGGNDTAFITRSILASSDPQFGYEMPDGIGGRTFRARGVSLKHLYYYAFFGVPFFRNSVNGDSMYSEVANSFIFNTPDSGLFVPNFASGENLFSVEIDIPHGTEREYKHALQTLLNNTFHLHATLEIKEMPCWVLVATKSVRKKLRTKSTKAVKGMYDKTRFDKWAADGIAFENLPAKSITQSIWGFNQGEPNFIDETGIDYPIDFKMDAIMTSLPDIRRALQKQGLDLIKSTRMMKTIVINSDN